MKKLIQMLLGLCVIPFLANAQGDKLPSFELHNRPTIVNVTDSTGAIVSINFIDTLTGKVRATFDLYKRCPFLKDASPEGIKYEQYNGGSFQPKDRVRAKKYVTKRLADRFADDEYEPEIKDFKEVKWVVFNTMADERVDTGHTAVTYAWQAGNGYGNVLGIGGIVYIINEHGKIVKTIVNNDFGFWMVDVGSNGKLLTFKKSSAYEDEKLLGDINLAVLDVKTQKVIYEDKKCEVGRGRIIGNDCLEYDNLATISTYRHTFIDFKSATRYDFDYTPSESDILGIEGRGKEYYIIRRGDIYEPLPLTNFQKTKLNQ